jgi:hypothetical protein
VTFKPLLIQVTVLYGKSLEGRAKKFVETGGQGWKGATLAAVTMRTLGRKNIYFY